MNQVTASAGTQRAGMQQLSFQLNDVATMFALGARPMQIFASQGGQVIQAVQLMTGGTSKMAAFLGGPWGLAITSAVVVLTPFVAKLFEGEQALKAVEFASDKMGEAQGILGSVMDATTGKITAQSQALVVLARAQAAAGRIGALSRRAEAERELTDIRRGEIQLDAHFGGGLRLVRVGDGTQDVITNFVQGRAGANFSIASLENRLDTGGISEEAFLRAASAITNFEVEGANIKVFEDLQAALNGDGDAARAIFGPQSGRKTRGARETEPRSEADLAADFASQSVSIERQTLQARLALATNAQDRADIENEILNLDRDQRIAEIEASDLGRARKDALIAQVEALLGVAPKIDEQGNLILSGNRGLEGQIIARERAAQIEKDAQSLADERFTAERDALQLQLGLADTDADRKTIALQLLEAEDAHLRSRLQSVLLSDAANDVEKQRAQIALDALNATAGTRRAAVGRQNETEVERFLREINATPDQINEALRGIEIDALDALNDGLTDAILGAKSLGDAFSRVADQIIADLLRIAIQQTIIKPLAGVLFGDGGGGGGGGGFLGKLLGGKGPKNLLSQSSLFAGEFATGGTIPTGQFGIVGEEGPEIAFAGAGGLGILSNSDSRKALGGGGVTSVSAPVNITIDATGADAAAIARLETKLEQMRAELRSTIVSTVQDAKDRRILNLGGAR
ncbi:MAG: phage tail length tape measure family protein [Erythrobacter sp.]|nr:phage tail length tape measure family protein [Erythrobacter sp.]MDZ4272991.1 phage tail length tape measure family protein [Erythrobacter sp.]